MDKPGNLIEESQPVLHEDCSQDLFSNFSQNSTFFDDEKLDVETQLQDFSWVQCDNVDCQKWRKVPTELANEIGDKDKWFCYMNSDRLYNDCEAVEENYAEYDRLARKHGLKFVMSKLTEGSLVWAKMVGYCRWPAIVTRDPVGGFFFTEDIHGDPTWYHVEYLGKCHSHAWIKASCISLYGHKEEPLDIMKKRSAQRGKKKSLTMSYNKSKPERKRYKNMEVSDAVLEADLMLRMNDKERLSCCQFKYDPRKQPLENEDVNIETQQKNNISNSPVRKKNCVIKPQTTTGKKKGTNSRKTTENLKQRTYCKNQESDIKENTKQKLHKTKTKQNKDKHKCQHCGDEDVEVKIKPQSEECKHEKGKVCVKQEPDDSGVGMHSALPYGQSSHSVSPYSQSAHSGLAYSQSSHNDLPCSQSSHVDTSQLHSNLKFNSSMMDKSKEEKFKIDLQMYKRNEKAFDHDLRRFMDRNNMILKRLPVWHNVPIGLFQLFLAVHERGGFLEVCCKRLWSQVYKELTDTHQTVGGHTAKFFYERNLYPYELYLSGKRFKQAVHKYTKKDKKKLVIENIQRDLKTESNETASQETKDLEAVLDELEDYSNFCQLEDDLEETGGLKVMKLPTTHRKSGINIKFHDDSTPEENFSPGIRIADTVTDFGKARSPGGSSALQCVPNYVMFSSSCGSSQGVEILHELQALEQNLEELDGDLDL